MNRTIAVKTRGQDKRISFVEVVRRPGARVEAEPEDDEFLKEPSLTGTIQEMHDQWLLGRRR